MKKLSIVLLLLASTSAFAFGGGGGGGRTRRFYERHGGVDAIGVHIHENGKNPPVIMCNPCEDPVDDQCVPRTCGDNMHCDTEQDACICDEGFVQNASNTCVDIFDLDEQTCLSKGYTWSGSLNNFLEPPFCVPCSSHSYSHLRCLNNDCRFKTLPSDKETCLQLGYYWITIFIGKPDEAKICVDNIEKAGPTFCAEHNCGGLPYPTCGGMNWYTHQPQEPNECFCTEA